MAIVELDIAEFKEIYPEFATLSDIIITSSFAEAELLCDNTPSSMVPYDPSNGDNKRKVLLYLLLAHLLSLREHSTVGTLASASEGSVSTSFNVDQRKGAGFYTQSQYGYKFWTMTARYRIGGFIIAGR